MTVDLEKGIIIKMITKLLQVITIYVPIIGGNETHLAVDRKARDKLYKILELALSLAACKEYYQDTLANGNIERLMVIIESYKEDNDIGIEYLDTEEFLEAINNILKTTSKERPA